ncbi:MAG: putative toxin-antitoxin system toxin component, PIN family [Nitrosomonadales bacterium]|nr:putative toxin-antitoxin system toxin component, PIN family [Nitrosomonadales bacterium]
MLVSAFLWQGTPGRLVGLAGEKECRFFTSRVLIDELSEVLQRKKLAKQLQATGLTAAQMLRNYQRLSTTVTARQLAQQVSRDADDDSVLACALAAQVDLIVSGDADLLVLKQFQGIRIVTAAQALKSFTIP